MFLCFICSNKSYLLDLLPQIGTFLDLALNTTWMFLLTILCHKFEFENTDSYLSKVGIELSNNTSIKKLTMSVILKLYNYFPMPQI